MLAAFIAKMQKARLPKMAIDAFSFFYPQLCSATQHLIFDRDIEPIPGDAIPHLDTLHPFADQGRRLRRQTVLIALNGGLGTSMGLSSPKALIPASHAHSFLDLILAHAARNRIELVLMNSFWTDAATRRTLAKRQVPAHPRIFVQHKFPKVLQHDLTPAIWPADRRYEWNPPGHGDIYSALATSGMLSELIDAGKRYAYVCNIDNLGAGIEWALLGYMSHHHIPFMMEVVEKPPTNLKGGHIARNRAGQLSLREIAQCPATETAAFTDISLYRWFNTNNIWIDLWQLREHLARCGTLRLPLICNPKTLNPNDPETPAVWQIETAVGAALSEFDGAGIVRVPTSRHYPVKTCADLLAVRSDCFTYHHRHGLQLHPLRQGNRVRVNLDPIYYGRLDQFEKRFPAGVPSLLECQSLTIRGDVYFDGPATIVGAVTINNRRPTPAHIEPGLRIDHDIILHPR